MQSGELGPSSSDDAGHGALAVGLINGSTQGSPHPAGATASSTNLVALEEIFRMSSPK